MSVAKEACARWIDLSDRRASGETLSADEFAFVCSHGATCPECRLEAAVWDEMESLVDGPAPRVDERQSDVAPRQPTRWPSVALAVGALAVAAAATAFVSRSAGGRAHDDAVSAPAVSLPPAPQDASAVLATTSGGSVEIDGRPGVVGQKLERGAVLYARAGSACVVIEPSVRSCVTPGSLVRVADLGAHRRLELLGGKVGVELDPQAPGTSFGIVTRDGSTVAIGTAFSVEVPPGDAPVVTHVLHGKVVVRASSGAEVRLGAHEWTSMEALAPSTLAAAEEDHDRALLMLTLPVEALPTAPRRVELPAVPAPAPRPVESSAANAAELLVAARESRARGDLAAAVTAYRALFEHHRSSAEAHTALVPWGELQLSQLSDPAGALASFDRYLVAGGPLEEEASFGRARALRALGRSADERDAIESFVRRFPDSPIGSPLRQRLPSLTEH